MNVHKLVYQILSFGWLLLESKQWNQVLQFVEKYKKKLFLWEFTLAKGVKRAYFFQLMAP